MNYFHQKILLTIVSLIILLEVCSATYYRNSVYGVREEDHKKPYEFNEAELTAIQAIVAFREVIGELLQKVGFNLPNLASIITRSDMNHIKSPVRVPEPLEDITVKSGGLGTALLRGMALSLPLLIPMATQIRRMSTDPPYIPPIPFIPDPYYDRALHRRRGKRSMSTTTHDYYRLKQLEHIVRQIDSMSKQFDRK